jgi:glycosyltransferase involved in cell wall biosynthesis
MPTFAIDSSSAEKSERSGVEWYAYHLIGALKRQALGADERLVFYSPGTLKWPFPFGWMKGRVSWEMLRRHADALLVPAQGVPLFGNVAAVVHDVGFARVPNVYAPSDRRRQARELRIALARAKIVFAVSEFTKRELVDLFKVSPDRISVAPNAVDASVYRRQDDAAVEPVRQRHRVGRHYFLYVGRLDAKKNVTTAIRAFELFKAGRGHGDPFELLLVGSPGYRFADVRTYADGSTVRRSVRTFGYLPEGDVAALMGGASGFLFPSWYEGFGVPPLEAAACGAPVAASDIGALREVMADAALFAGPGEPEAWARAMTRLATEQGLAADLRTRGFVRAAAYSWDKTAEIVLGGLRKLV